MKDNQHEQLFTELTPEEAAVIEGGVRITLSKIKCVKANMDTPASLNSDDVYIKLGNQTIWGPKSMDDGHEINLGNLATDIPGSTVKIGLWDDDPAPNPDDKIQERTYGITNSWRTVSFMNANGSHYQLTFYVSA